jgi:hypothetical protein
MNQPAAAADDTTARPTPGAPITAARFLAALALACGLFFLLLVLFAVAGLGIFGVAPALVVGVTLTSRITRIRRMGILVTLGLLSFLIVVVGTYVVAVLYILASRAPS